MESYRPETLKTFNRVFSDQQKSEVPAYPTKHFRLAY